MDSAGDKEPQLGAFHRVFHQPLGILLGIFLLGWSLIGPSLRPGVGLLILFAFRQVAQLTCALAAPPGMIWRRPGVPSLLVTYDVANDFFFSGHTAIAVLGAIELASIAPGPVAIAAGLVAVFEAITVLVLRAHYTMDVFTGNVALVAPAGMVTLDGTVAAKLLLDSAIFAPPTGAALLKLTVPVDDCTPPTTLDGLTVIEANTGSGGLTVSVAVFVVPP